MMGAIWAAGMTKGVDQATCVELATRWLVLTIVSTIITIALIVFRWWTRRSGESVEDPHL
jgi:hypothetical protein